MDFASDLRDGALGSFAAFRAWLALGLALLEFTELGERLGQER